jgi:hypothetical protein
MRTEAESSAISERKGIEQQKVSSDAQRYGRNR